MDKLENFDLPRQRGRLIGRPTLKWVAWIAGAVLLLAAAVAVFVQVDLLRSHPITHGSSYWSSGLPDGCVGFRPQDEDARCAAVLFEPDGPLGIGFSVRNTGRFPLTIESVESFGTFSDNTLAEMYPVLPPEGALFDPAATRPFEPITLEPGEEATLQLMGHMRDCLAVRDHWAPGGGMVVETVRLTVRWLLMSTDVEVPLPQVLHIGSPGDSRCR